MDKTETEIFKNPRKDTSVEWLRYTEDIFFICNHGMEYLEIFLQEVFNFNPDLEFTYESNKKEIPFLDLKVKSGDGKISTNFYFKSTDRHQHLPFTSSHPNHTRTSIL